MEDNTKNNNNKEVKIIILPNKKCDILNYIVNNSRAQCQSCVPRIFAIINCLLRRSLFGVLFCVLFCVLHEFFAVLGVLLGQVASERVFWLGVVD